MESPACLRLDCFGQLPGFFIAPADGLDRFGIVFVKSQLRLKSYSYVDYFTAMGQFVGKMDNFFFGYNLSGQPIQIFMGCYYFSRPVESEIPQ
jgi:hypothetical protein